MNAFLCHGFIVFGANLRAGLTNMVKCFFPVPDAIAFDIAVKVAIGCICSFFSL